ILDQMTGGRACAGFARGYQRRWVDVMAQQTHGIHGALPHQHDAIDAADRADAFLSGKVLENPGWRDAVESRGNERLGRRRREWRAEGSGRRTEAGAE